MSCLTCKHWKGYCDIDVSNGYVQTDCDYYEQKNL